MIEEYRFVMTVKVDFDKLKENYPEARYLDAEDFALKVAEDAVITNKNWGYSVEVVEELFA